MTATSTEIEVVSLEAFEFEIACDFGDGVIATTGVGVHDDPATWVLFKAHECGKAAALSCDRCKLVRYDGYGVIECTHCGDYFLNRDFYRRAERIDKG